MRPLLLLLLAACGARDLDGDGFKDEEDCNDRDPKIFLGAPEQCNGVDDDCDGFVDEGVSIVAYWDRDGDGYGDDAYASRVCEVPADGSETGGDCDDANPDVAPGVAEACNGRDDNCDGQIDEGAGGTYYTDADGDGHGAGAGQPGGCVPGPGQSILGDDCNDDNSEQYPGNLEICDGVDNDCDGAVDDGATSTLLYEDADGDGYGNPAGPTSVGCGTAPGWADNALDCDDTNPNLSPDAEDVQFDGIDQDCDGFVDEYGVPVPYATLEDALAAAPDGAVVQLDQGTFFDSVDLTGRDVTLAGEGCDRTTLYADAGGSVVTADAGRITGLTISAGTGTSDGTEENGGGMLISGDVLADHVCIVGNSVTGRGAGAEVASGTLTLEDSTVDRNYAVDNGGGVHVSVGATLVATRTRFTGNSTVGDGGGVGINGGTLDAYNSIFAGNTAGDDGGAILVATATDEVPDPDVLTRGDAVVDHCTFHGNQALDLVFTDLDLSRGQAIFTWGSTLALTSSVFTGHPHLGEVLEDNGVTAPDGVAKEYPVFTFSNLGFFDNADFDYEYLWFSESVHLPPRYVRDDPSLAWDEWDFHLLPGSGWIDAGSVVELDPDGSRADLGAYGGPLAESTFDASYTQDFDGDGLLDGFEAHYGLDPLVDDADTDVDADGLTALDEQSTGSDPTIADTDTDGVNDADEVALGSDPVRPADHAPSADAGKDRWVLAGEQATVDGSGSWDPDRDQLTWSWALTAPGGSAVTAVDDPTAPIATFTPDVGGTYTLVLTVSDGGVSEQDTVLVEGVAGLVVPDDYPTIGEAMANVPAGGMIAVRPGTYVENLDLGGVSMTIAGVGDSPDDVVIDGGYVASVIQATNYEFATVANLTLEHGAGAIGGGMAAINATLDLHQVNIRDCTAIDSGGGLYSGYTDLTLDDVAITGCTAATGAGAYVDSGRTTVVGSTFADNYATLEGGGVWINNFHDPTEDQIFTFDNSVFQGNDAPTGSAFRVDDDHFARVTVRQCAFVDNGGSPSAFSVHNGTINVVNTLFAYDDSSGYLFGDTAFPDFGALSDTRWSSLPETWDPAIRTPGVVLELDPSFARWTDDGIADDLLGLRPGSALVDAGVPLFRDPDGTVADVGPGGGPLAQPSLLRFARDDDHDGMSDGWEVTFGLDPLVDDSAADPDGDGATNAAEYAAGTDPTVP